MKRIFKILAVAVLMWAVVLGFVFALKYYPDALALAAAIVGSIILASVFVDR